MAHEHSFVALRAELEGAGDACGPISETFQN